MSNYSDSAYKTVGTGPKHTPPRSRDDLFRMKPLNRRDRRAQASVMKGSKP